MNRISKRLLSLLGFAALGLGALMMAPAPADAEGPGFSQGLKPPPYKYQSQYESMSGLYLNLGNGTYARVPTIRLRAGAVKAREVAAANVRSVGHFMPSVGHFQVGSSNAESRVVLPIRPRYSYKRSYGYGRGYGGSGYGYMPPFYGQPGYGQPGYAPPGFSGYGSGYRPLGYGQYGFNAGQALQGLPSAQPQTAYVGSFNAPRPMLPVQQAQQPRPDFEPKFLHFNGATVKSGRLPTVLKPAGRHFIRVE